MSSSAPSASPSVTPGGASPVHVALDDTIGAVFIGLIIAAILYGIINVQTMTYFQSSKGDPKYLRYMIALLWILITSQITFVAHYNYYILITNFTNLSVVGKITWSWSTPILTSEISDFIIRLYYSRRIWILSDRNRFLTTAAIFWNLVAFGSSVAFTAKLFPLNLLSEISSFSWLMYMSLSSGVAADLWTATSVCYFLRKDRSGIQRTDTLVNKLTVYIVGTGLLTSICAICSLITYAAMPDNSIFVAIYSNLAKLYFNALLANLNTRKRLRDDLAIDFSDYETGTYQMRRNMDIGKQLASGVQFSSETENSPDVSLSHCKCKTRSFTRHDSSGDRESDDTKLERVVDSGSAASTLGI